MKTGYRMKTTSRKDSASLSAPAEGGRTTAAHQRSCHRLSARSAQAGATKTDLWSHQAWTARKVCARRWRTYARSCRFPCAGSIPTMAQNSSMHISTAIASRVPSSSRAAGLTKKMTMLTLSKRTGRMCGGCWAMGCMTLGPALQAMNDLYGNQLRLFQNLFLPSVKLARKVRVGSRIRRIYEGPQTPFQRVCDSPRSDPG